MQTEILGSVGSFICFIAMVIFTVRMRRAKATYVYDYQAALRFDGKRCKLLTPGLHRTSGSTPTLVDLRPQQFILESQLCKDALFANCVISLGGELRVCDAEAAVIAFKNILEDSLTLVRGTVRSAISHRVVESGPAGRADLAHTLTEEFNRELRTRGVEVQNLEITELWAQKVAYTIPATAN
jgi:hypothetical protein